MIFSPSLFFFLCFFPLVDVGHHPPKLFDDVPPALSGLTVV